MKFEIKEEGLCLTLMVDGVRFAQWMNDRNKDIMRELVRLAQKGQEVGEDGLEQARAFINDARDVINATRNRYGPSAFLKLWVNPQYASLLSSRATPFGVTPITVEQVLRNDGVAVEVGSIYMKLPFEVHVIDDGKHKEEQGTWRDRDPLL